MRKNVVEWLRLDDIIFYLLIWINSFLSSVFVTLGDNNKRNFYRIISVAGFSAFLSFSIISILIKGSPEKHWYYIGLSTLIGLSSKYQEEILLTILYKIGLLANKNLFKEESDDCEK